MINRRFDWPCDYRIPYIDYRIADFPGENQQSDNRYTPSDVTLRARDRAQLAASSSAPTPQWQHCAHVGSLSWLLRQSHLVAVFSDTRSSYSFFGGRAPGTAFQLGTVLRGDSFSCVVGPSWAGVYANRPQVHARYRDRQSYARSGVGDATGS